MAVTTSDKAVTDYLDNLLNDSLLDTALIIPPTSSPEPVQAEPIQVEPIQAEPIQAEPIQVEPIQAEPIQVEPIQVELAQPSRETRPRSADTTDVTRRMVPVFDAFQLMSLQGERTLQHRHLMWLGVHELLPLIRHLPSSGLRQYCLRQCETLLRQARTDR